MRRGQVAVTGPENADLEAIIVAMHVEFGLARRDDAWQWVVDAWDATTPRGVALGRVLHQSGEVRALRAEGAHLARLMEHAAERHTARRGGVPGVNDPLPGVITPGQAELDVHGDDDGFQVGVLWSGHRDLPPPHIGVERAKLC